MILPVFIRGHLTFTIDGHTLEFIHQSLSVFGVTGLSWAPLDPYTHFGKTVQVQIRIPAQPQPLTFITPAVILRERTQYAEYLGLRFDLAPGVRTTMEELVRKQGFYPTEYVRKYPRIPSSEQVQTFPLRALGIPQVKRAARTGLEPSTGDPILFDVGNLSPNGVLLSTENQQASSLNPGDRIDLMIEPRGWFPHKVELEGLICRVSDELIPSTQNLRRYFGIKFSRVDETNRVIFLDLLRDILEKIQKKPGRAP
jgi:hypothetical protein